MQCCLGNQPVDLLNGPGAASDYVEISVTHTGIGMEAAARATVFEPFFTTTPAGQGTGLGLSQLNGVVRQSTGRPQCARETIGGTNCMGPRGAAANLRVSRRVTDTIAAHDDRHSP
ncbi:ATP-binding protein [Acidisphaera sp. L21]|uniref:ATP-binding protein n=1 Tax=Acidisphaera sp. L21 TaxID=1641851 RepID=UPI00300523F0